MERLYGFLFDCVGHELSSYGQTSSLHGMLKKAMNFYQVGSFPTLSAAMEDVNQDLFALYDDNILMAAAMMFCFDFTKGRLHFCPAAIPELLYRPKNTEKYMVKELRSPLLGYELSSKFPEETVELADMSNVVFATDGFSDLLSLSGQPEVDLESAKFDDFAAIFVELYK